MHEQIKTTEAKAKAVAAAGREDDHARQDRHAGQPPARPRLRLREGRRCASSSMSWRTRYAARPGGYTRIVKLGPAARRRRAPGDIWSSSRELSRDNGLDARERGARRRAPSLCPPAGVRRRAIRGLAASAGRPDRPGRARGGDREGDRSTACEPLSRAARTPGCMPEARWPRSCARRRLDVETMRRALNAWLPEDVVVRQVAEVDEAFDPRQGRCAASLSLRHRQRPGAPGDGPPPGLARRRRPGHDAMKQAAQSVIGTHDFAAFASPVRQPGRSARCATCRASTFTARATPSSIDVEGNAFLPHQVRRMAGALVEVGRGKLGVEDYKGLLAGEPASAGPVGAAAGPEPDERQVSGRPVRGFDVAPSLVRQED